MKEIHELNLPDGVRYTDDHEWTKAEEEKVRIGITDYAQDQLGEIIFVEVPEVGDTLDKGETFGSLESVKAVSDMNMPVGGEVLAVNTALEDAPDMVNQDPYSGGWIIEINPSDPSELDQLMDKNAYLEMLKGLEE
jgi:glycine cleavage system H protein